MLLVYPPAAKCGEPPAGITRLAAVLKAHGHNAILWDANLEGIRDLYLERSPKALGFEQHIRDSKTYQNRDRYTHAVKRLNTLLQGCCNGYDITLGNFSSDLYSPYRIEDLNRAAEEYQANPFTPMFRKRLQQEITENSVKYVGISIQYLSQAVCSFALAGLIRTEFPQLTIVFGGGLITTWTRLPGWSNPFSSWCDHLIGGPGELPLLKLLGIEPSKNEMTAAPDYTTLKDLPYLSPGFILPYTASMGCSWKRCRFCPETAEGNPYIPVAVSRASQTIRELRELYNPVLIHILDNEISPALLRKLAQEPPGAPWYSFSRFIDDLLDPEFCRALKEAGCVMLKLGLESGNQRVLEQMDKGINLEKASIILKNLNQAGIRSYVYIMFGSPWENAEAAEDTVQFLEKNAEYLGGLNTAIFNMPRSGTEAEETAVRKKREDLSLYYDFIHPLGWDRYKIRRFLTRRIYKNSTLGPAIKSVPFLFNANHAPFFRRP